jgi:hypothetical protein
MTYQRFTVFTQDADNIISIGPTATARRRQFTWKLKGNRSYHDVKKLKLSIESIHCRNMDIIIQGDQNKQFQTRAVNNAIDGADDGVNSIVGKTTAMGNTDEKELYTIRCNGVSSENHLDSRPAEYKTGAIIYTGALNFHNTNPKECFCYEVNKDILTSDFSLYIDTNFHISATNVNTLGLAPNLQVAITFILYDE